MKNVTTIPSLIDAPVESLATRLMWGTAARLCPVVGIVSTRPVVMYGGMRVQPRILESYSLAVRLQDTSARLGMLLGPMLVLFEALLRMLGLGGRNDKPAPVNMDEICALEADIARIGRTAHYWARAMQSVCRQIEKTKAKSRRYTVPDWFVWLQYMGMETSPTRLRTVMAAFSVKGRVAVMRLSGVKTLRGFISEMSDILTEANRVTIDLSERSLARGVWRVHLPPD